MKDSVLHVQSLRFHNNVVYVYCLAGEISRYRTMKSVHVSSVWVAAAG